MNAKAHYAATLIIAGTGVLVWVAVQSLLDGHWIAANRAIPIVLLFAIMAIFTTYRRLHDLELTPTWLVLAMGFLGVAVYAFWATSNSRPDTAPGWAMFVILAALPVGLLWLGVHRIRHPAPRGAADRSGGDS